MFRLAVTKYIKIKNIILILALFLFFILPSSSANTAYIDNSSDNDSFVSPVRHGSNSSDYQEVQSFDGSNQVITEENVGADHFENKFPDSYSSNIDSNENYGALTNSQNLCQ